MHLRHEQRAGDGVLDAVEELADDPEARRHDAARRPGVDALLEDVDREDAVDEAAQRRGDPEPLGVERAGVEADHELRRSEAAGEELEVRGEIGAARLLARLDQDEQAGVRDARRPRGLDRQERCECGVAVVGAAAAVEPIALEDRDPRAEPVAPSGHLGLLVEVAVEQDRAFREGRVGRRDLAHDQRRQAVDALDVDRHALDRPRREPAVDELDGPLHVAVGLPVGVVGRRHVRDRDVVLQRRQDLVGPAAGDVLGQLCHRADGTAPLSVAGA